MTTIDDKTKIPLFAALGAVSTVVGGIVWLTQISFTGNANAAAIERIENRQEKYLDDVQTIRADLSLIKGMLKHR